ncbi:MAG: PKD domain-containing protein [Candidatus Bathyarchaeota archaeon]|nr:PKD domain-containing protein [Candidatus Bathyarchaeota archaeon]
MKIKLNVIVLLTSLVFLSLMFPYLPASSAQTQPVVALDPPSYTATEVGEVFTMNMTISDVEDLWAWHTEITWDPDCIELLEAPIEGEFLTDSSTTLFVTMDPSNGTINSGVTSTILSSKTGVSGSGVLASFNFKVIKQCSGTPVTLFNISLRSPNTQGNPSFPAPYITPVSDSFTGAVTLIVPGPPVASAGKDQTVPQGTSVVLNGSQSISTGENPIYTWTFMDGTVQTLEGELVDYVFDASGDHEVTLTITDSLGTDSDTVTITALDTLPPVAVISSDGAPVSQPVTLDVGGSILLDGSRSYDPENGTIIAYHWDPGNKDIGTTVTKNCTYLTAGTYTVLLTVFDAERNNSTASVTVYVGQTSDASGSPGNTYAPSQNPNQSPAQESFAAMPPAMIGILVAVTVFTLAGSISWLKKRK